jgi:hypothetical protein
LWARINFFGAAEVVDSLHFRHITGTFVRAARRAPPTLPITVVTLLGHRPDRLA